jgi:hypothetical protein
LTGIDDFLSVEPYLRASGGDVAKARALYASEHPGSPVFSEAYFQKLVDQFGGKSDADLDRLMVQSQALSRVTDPYDYYTRLAGEVEARDVQSRADFAPDQRAATAPYSSQGIAPEDMIVLNRGGGVQESRTGTFTLDYFGTPVRILQNPTPQQARGFMDRTKYKAARRIVDPETGDTFIWDANDPALHAMVAEQLGIKPGDKTIMDMIGID